MKVKNENNYLKSKIKDLPKWLKWTIGILVTIFVIILAMSINKNEKGILITTDLVKKRPIEQSIFCSGKLESADKQEFFTPVDSTLMELTVEVGDQVKKGQELGRLDTLELGRQYEEAKAKLTIKQAELAETAANNDVLNLESAEAQYTKAKNNFERISFLLEEGAVAAEELELSRANYIEAKTAYEQIKTRVQQNAAPKRVESLKAQIMLAKQEAAQAKERLDLANFISKKDGIVLFVGAEKGNRVMEGSQILVIGSNSELEVTARVNEIDAGSLKVGQPVKVTCTTLPDKKFNGKITRVSAVAVTENTNGNANISVPVTIKLQGDTTGLKPGYTMNLNIITMEERELLTIPFEAIISKNGQKLVYVIENDTARERKLKTKKGNELYDIVLSGLKQGEQVILTPPPELKNNQKIIIGDQNDKNN